MKFSEKLRRGRAHLLIVAVMILTAVVVVNLEDKALTSEVGHHPEHVELPGQ
ncbi:hypothetical protein [Croceicoccus naphthovorans]|uniref:hypothetical protein n=1 Tax=Croceicoccus naphthovorans TaxID=1348774 RepID=UPI0012E01299|nr:hypothetical protein [Croceicoccus naphthovorans]MBB3988917.1 hypothetical protein [Croceicoccus naphthovorans]